MNQVIISSFILFSLFSASFNGESFNKSRVNFNIKMDESEYPIEVQFITHSHISFNQVKPGDLSLDTTLLCNKPYTIVFANADSKTERVYFSNKNCRDTVVKVEMQKLDLKKH